MNLKTRLADLYILSERFKCDRDKLKLLKNNETKSKQTEGKFSAIVFFNFG